MQSHISRQISDLEKECGSPLFRRTGRGVVLTEFGEFVEKRARQWIRESEGFFADIKQSSKVPMGQVKVGILPSAAHPLMTQVFRVFASHTSRSSVGDSEPAPDLPSGPEAGLGLPGRFDVVPQRVPLRDAQGHQRDAGGGVTLQPAATAARAKSPSHVARSRESASRLMAVARCTAS